MKLQVNCYSMILSFFFFSVSLSSLEIDHKKLIEESKEKLNSLDARDQSQAYFDLAKLYLKEQDQENAFDTFLKSLDNKVSETNKITSTESNKKALALYLDPKSSSSFETSTLIIREFLPEIKTHPNDLLLSYLIAIAYGNLNRWEEFFEFFTSAYQIYPEHFLAYKTKGILHVKLMERRRLESEKEIQREAALKNFEQAAKLEPNDVSLYKLMINFSFNERKAEQVQLCLNKIIDGNIIIPRSDVFFYVKEAVDIKENQLAQRFINKALEWHQSSRLITMSQNYLDAHK